MLSKMCYVPQIVPLLGTTEWENKTVCSPFSSLKSAAELLVMCFSSLFHLSIPHPRCTEVIGNGIGFIKAGCVFTRKE